MNVAAELSYHVVRRIYACTTCIRDDKLHLPISVILRLADNALSQLTFSLRMNKSFPVMS